MCYGFVTKDNTYIVPKPFHISLSEFDYYVTVIFPEGIPDNELGEHFTDIIRLF